MPMSPEKKKFYTFRNWSIYQVKGVIKMLEKMRSKAHDLERLDITSTTHDMSYALEHLYDLRDDLSRLTFED